MSGYLMVKKATTAQLRKKKFNRNEAVLFIEELKSLMSKHDPVNTEILAEALLLTLCSFFSRKLSVAKVRVLTQRVLRVYEEAHKTPLAKNSK